jgi:DNA-binding response OmpR family regulator
VTSQPIPPPPEEVQKIVVVEDDPAILDMIATALRSRHYEVTTFTDPSKALDWLTGARWDVDLVVTDIMMPERSGLALAKAIRAKAGRVAILLISAWLSDEALWGEDQQDLPFLAKPFTMPELLGAVEEAMARFPRPTRDSP